MLYVYVLTALSLLCLALIVWLTHKSTKRALPVVRNRTCATCVHFDKERMQAEFARQPAFMQAARVLSPAEMLYPKALDENGNATGQLAAPKEALRMKWNDFGVCDEHDEGRFHSDTCDKHTAREAV